jgi:cytochrome c oxidase subunit 3
MSARVAPLSDAARTPRHEDVALRVESAEFGMWIFLATEILFFGGLLFAYAVARAHWPDGFAIAGRRTDVVLGTLNTALLLTSSCAAALAVAADEHGEHRWVPRLLWITAALGCAFLAVKGVEYVHEWREGLVPGPRFALTTTAGAELFWLLYFLTTALHALHLTIGIVVIAAFAWGARRPSGWARAPRLQVAALYWHFVDVLWIFLYPLLYLVGRAPT